MLAGLYSESYDTLGLILCHLVTVSSIRILLLKLKHFLLNKISHFGTRRLDIQCII